MAEKDTVVAETPVTLVVTDGVEKNGSHHPAQGQVPADEEATSTAVSSETICDLTEPTVLEAVKASEDVAQLETWITAEYSGAKRTAVIQAIQDRQSQLSQAALDQFYGVYKFALKRLKLIFEFRVKYDPGDRAWVLLAVKRARKLGLSSVNSPLPERVQEGSEDHLKLAEEVNSLSRNQKERLAKNVCQILATNKLHFAKVTAENGDITAGVELAFIVLCRWKLFDLDRTIGRIELPLETKLSGHLAPAVRDRLSTIKLKGALPLRDCYDLLENVINSTPPPRREQAYVCRFSGPNQILTDVELEKLCIQVWEISRKALLDLRGHSIEAPPESPNPINQYASTLKFFYEVIDQVSFHARMAFKHLKSDLTESKPKKQQKVKKKDKKKKQ